MSEPRDDKYEAIMALLDEIDGYAADSRGCYENARGNDANCYAATKLIREFLAALAAARSAPQINHLTKD